jgi:hypothetical protein
MDGSRRPSLGPSRRDYRRTERVSTRGVVLTRTRYDFDHIDKKIFATIETPATRRAGDAARPPRFGT